MDFLPEIVDIILKSAISGQDFKHLTNDDKSLIENIISEIIEAYGSSNFESFIFNLVELHKTYTKFFPEDFHSSFQDFLADRNMWEWVFTSMDKNPTKYDWEASKYLSLDLKERMVNQELFLK